MLLREQRKFIADESRPLAEEPWPAAEEISSAIKHSA